MTQTRVLCIGDVIRNAIVFNPRQREDRNMNTDSLLQAVTELIAATPAYAGTPAR